MYLDGSPTELADTYYPLDVALSTRVADARKIPGGGVILLATMGYTARRVHEEIYAHMPDADERDELGLAAGEPVLCMTRVSEDEAGRPFQVDVSVFPVAGQRLRYELRIC
jgi:DNA-binding GntR family transcriptional regulator